jgi:ABC-2 type transport system ATP-binding protein
VTTSESESSSAGAKRPAAQKSGARDRSLAIECKGLEKIYRSGFFRIPYTGLESLDLQVERGQVFGFIGPNGAGKTTTIKILMGLQFATAGTASVLGIDHRDPECRREVGFLPERPYFYQHLTAVEFLDFYGQLFDLDKATRTKRANELLERVDLGRFRDVPLRAYSKGMLQRAGVAQALINDPALVVLDEPMSGLDPRGRALIRDLILEERDRGRTVFFSSHILADVERMCDRVAILVKGKLRGCGTMQELVGDAVSHVDIRCTGADDAELPGKRVAGVQRVAPDQVDATLAAISLAGGHVLEVTQHRPHLEQVLLDEMDQQAELDAKKLGVL